jgi:membrane-anchored protein YejM (alkaline phosphatase superfamily)
MTPTKAPRFPAVVLAWAVNTLVGAAIGIVWLSGLPIGANGRSLLFVGAALVSNTAMLALLPAIVVLLLALVLPSGRVLAVAQAFLWTLFQVVLFADTRIWRLFRYHFNGMVWNVLTTRGSEDAVEIGPRDWLPVALVAVVYLATMAFAWRYWLLPEAPRLEWKLPRRLARTAGLAIVACVLLDKGLYAWADLARDRSITGLARAFPQYQRFTVQKLAKSVFHARLEDRPSVALAAGERMLRYPIAEPAVDPKGARPNVLVVVIDSLRADMLGPETMPRTTAFLARARTFADHLSGGNATRFGVFSILYGIHGTYWMPVVEEHAPPVLLTVLAKLGYDFHVLSTASLDFPEFRSTAFVRIEDQVEDHFPFATKHECDARVASRFDEWLGERETAGKRAPFFCFALVDAPHGGYDWPPEDTVFRPFAQHVDYLKMSGKPTKDEIAAVFNSYRNAVHFGDAIAGRMIDALERRHLLDDTIVVITGDHGEEFFEHGFFGHTSNFTLVQTHVPFVVGGPGFPQGVESRPTCHVDLAPTLLEICGADPKARTQWSQGENLMSPPEHRDRIFGGWDEAAIRVDGGILLVPLEGARGFVEAYDEDWNRLDDAFVAKSGAAIAKLAQECRRFLR